MENYQLRRGFGYIALVGLMPAIMLLILLAVNAAGVFSDVSDIVVFRKAESELTDMLISKALNNLPVNHNVIIDPGASSQLLIWSDSAEYGAEKIKIISEMYSMNYTLSSLSHFGDFSKFPPMYQYEPGKKHLFIRITRENSTQPFMVEAAVEVSNGSFRVLWRREFAVYYSK